MHFLSIRTTILSLFGHLAITAPTSDFDIVPSIFKKLDNLAYDTRVDTYLNLPADLQKSYWVEKINNFIQTRQNSLNETQFNALESIAGSYTKLLLPTTKQLLIDEFGFATAKTLLTTLHSDDSDPDISTRDTASKGGFTRECQCSVESDWCGPWKKCVGWNQLPPSEECSTWKVGTCGTFWNYRCNGMCR